MLKTIVLRMQDKRTQKGGPAKQIAIPRICSGRADIGGHRWVFWKKNTHNIWRIENLSKPLPVRSIPVVTNIQVHVGSEAAKQ